MNLLYKINKLIFFIFLFYLIDFLFFLFFLFIVQVRGASSNLVTLQVVLIS